MKGKAGPPPGGSVSVPTAWGQDVSETRIKSVTDEHQNPRPSRAWTGRPTELVYAGVVCATPSRGFQFDLFWIGGRCRPPSHNKRPGPAPPGRSSICVSERHLLSRKSAAIPWVSKERNSPLPVRTVPSERVIRERLTFRAE